MFDYDYNRIATAMAQIPGVMSKVDETVADLNLGFANVETAVEEITAAELVRIREDWKRIYADMQTDMSGINGSAHLVDELFKEGDKKCHGIVQG